MSGHAFTASALCNLFPATKPHLPDLVLHHTEAAVPEYHNMTLFPGLFPTLYLFGLGGFEDSARLTPLSFDCQARYSLNILDRHFHYHETFLFVILNMLQRRCAHLQTSFVVHKPNFDSVARNLTSVSVHVLQCLASRLKHECKLSSLTPKEQNALKLLCQVNTMSA